MGKELYIKQLKPNLYLLDETHEWFGGVDRQHPFSLKEDKNYSQDHSVICYRI